MKLQHLQPQTRFFLQMAVKTLFISTTLFMLGSFTRSHAQNRSIVLSPINFEQGCPSLDESVVQVSIDGRKMASLATTSVPPGTRSLSVATSTSNNLTIKEIKYEDWESSPGTSIIPRTQTFTPNGATANVSITVYNPNTSAPARLTITVACGAPPTSQRLPIIFLPGVAGSELFFEIVNPAPNEDYGNRGVWPFAPSENRGRMMLNPDGKTSAIEGSTIFVKEILKGSPPGDFYGKMLQFLRIKGYKTGDLLFSFDKSKNLFEFAYDWRLDNATHFTNLDKVIDDALKQNPGAKKVILLAHSMGGVIARAYILSRPERAAKVDSVITMGTPYWGAPKPYYALVSGYTFDNPTVRQELMKILTQNFPAAYELMSNYQFVYDDTNRRMLTLEETRSIKYKGFTDVTPRFFKDKYDESPDNIWSFNQGLVRLAQDFNRPFAPEKIRSPCPQASSTM